MAQIKELMHQHGLVAADIVAAHKKPATDRTVRQTRPVAAKYRDDQGNSWSGRGLKPKWLTAALAAGRRIEDFAV
jgi:DNA-binding protein H-NS